MLFLAHLVIAKAIVKTYEHLIDKDNVKIDYRVVLFGSLFPYIVDKPIFLLLKNTMINDRLFAHTLLFSIFLIILGYIYLNNNLLTLEISSLIHLILDSMWLFPSTFLYPVYGLNFPLKLVFGVFPNYLLKLFSLPVLLIFEVIGGCILIHYFILFKKHISIYDFFRYGKL